jgi:mono/diheme cytochrome c family protein
MHRCLATLIVLFLGGVGFVSGETPSASPERGRAAVRGQPPLNPPLWSRRAFENVWKQWGAAEKPADYDDAFRQRYGLHRAPYENHGLPMGLHEAPGLLGKGITNDCLICHAGTIAGQTYIGLGNASVDIQSLLEEMNAAQGLKFKFPFHFSQTRGTIDPLTPTNFLMGLRDADLNLRVKQVRLDSRNDAASDPPAWWLIKKKKTRDWTGAIDARSTRVDLVNLLSPFNSGTYIKKQQPLFADIHAFLLRLEAPRYPFPIDQARAGQGRELFEQNCARCHGTYGPKWKYPNKIVPLAEIGTDRNLAESLSDKLAEHYNQTWLAKEIGPEGKPFQFTAHQGYQAPPLDGVWATAPYFHNGSVPTVYHVLNSKARPKIYTRSYRTGREDYDPVKVGWKVTVLDRSPEAKMSGAERRKIYDTTRPGHGNGGHTFGDDLTEEERAAVIEYLKTL